MLLKNVFLASTFSAIGLAQDVDNNDVPQQCRSVCASIVSLTQNCDQQNNDNDSGYINCVCSSQNAGTQIPICEACIAANDPDGRDNDVNDLVRSCSFTTTSYNPSAAATASGSDAVSSVSPQPSGSAIPPAVSSFLSSVTASAGSRTASAGATQTTGSAAQQSTNAAPMPTAGMVGVGLGAMGAAWGML